jgi:putative PIN family toxin of toxin-antitoxin system
MQLRVVADSNVLISALHSGGGPPGVVVDHARRGDFTLYLSAFILEEVARILIDKLHWTPQRVFSALVGLRNAGTVVDPGPPRLHILPDETDNQIIECALAARARYLVTGDRALLALGTHGRVRIVSPRVFLDAEPWVIRQRLS